MAILVAIAVVVPAFALVIEHVGNVRISERHHSRHDTYVVPVVFTRALVLSMVLMAFVGLLLAFICAESDLTADTTAVLAFFDSYVVTCFVLWMALCRYKVSAFGDRMVVTPLVGRDVWVSYDQIERLAWTGVHKGSGYRDLSVYVDGRRVTTILGIVDMEQILMRIDRFDALERSS